MKPSGINTLLLTGIGLTCLFSSITMASPYAEYFEQYQQQYQQRHDMQTHLISRGDYTLNVREFGKDNAYDDEAKPTIVMMHGFPDSQILYDKLAPKLADNYHIVTFDFLGWGKSDAPVDFSYSVDSLATDIGTVVTALELPQVVLLMHDLSGLPAIDWGLENQDIVAGMVLLNTFYGPMDGLVPPDAIQFYGTPNPLRAEIERVVTQTEFLWLSGFEHQIEKFFDRQNVHDTYAKLFTHQSLGIRPAFLQTTRSLFEDVANRAIAQYTEIPQMHKPVAIIFGQNDPFITPQIAQQFHQLFPNSQLHFVKEAGHYVQLDQADAVSDLITNYMDTFWDR